MIKYQTGLTFEEQIEYWYNSKEEDEHQLGKYLLYRVEEAYQEGYSAGADDGSDSSYEEGYENGYDEGWSDAKSLYEKGQ